MTRTLFGIAKRGSFALIIAGLLAFGSLASANDKDKDKNPQRPTPPPASKPSPSAAPSRPSMPTPAARPAAPTPSTPGRPGGFTPGTPSTPSTPGRPGGFTPSTPSTPSTPGRPGGFTPSTPSTPSTPGRPGGFTPSTPSTPSTPGRPGGFTPSTPSTPSTPGRPGGFTPGTPSTPSTPGRPGGFTPGPTTPTTPSNPGHPGGFTPGTPGGSGGHPGGFTPGTPGGNGGRPGGFTPGTPGGNGFHPTTPHNPVIHTPPARGTFERSNHNGDAVRYRPNGRISDLHDTHRGMDIHQGLNGGRRVIVVRPDHTRTFFERGRPGWVQKPYEFHGRSYERRTYFFHGHQYDNFYRGYRFRGQDFHAYAPSFFFGRSYYQWAYNPWSRPVHYRWGWLGQPWMRQYGYYFNPYPVYPSAAFWLTDYLISSSLQSAYAAQQEGGEVFGDPGSGAAPLTPEVKQQISDEVRDQLAIENQESQQPAGLDPSQTGIAHILGDVANGHSHTFVVGVALDVVDGSGMECSLSDGDVLSLQQAPQQDQTSATLVVLSSKGGQECPKSDYVQIALSDLQEMQNHMRSTIDQGLQELQNNQGKDGLPQAPASMPNSRPDYIAVAPQPDSNIASEIQQQGQQADMAQSDVTNSMNQGGGGQPTPTINAGQNFAEVESIMGQPNSKATVGSKTIYNYNGMKVTFVGGRVVDIE